MLERRRRYTIAALAVLASLPASPVAAQITNSPISHGSATPPWASSGRSTSTGMANTNGVRTNPPASAHRAWILSEVQRTAPSRNESAAIETLEKRIERVSWEDEPLESVVEWIRQQGPANVVPVWRALDDIGVQRDTLVTLELRDVTAHQLLVELCDQLAPFGGMGFQGHGNVIRISSQRHLDSKLYIRVYEVRDVAFDVPDFIPLGGCSAPVAAAGGGGADGYIPLEVRMDKLADIVRNAIAPELRVENGGDCSVQVFKSSLVVRAPISVHQKIGGDFYLP